MVKIIDRVAFEVAGIEIYWYGIIITFAVLTGFILAVRESKRQSMDPEFFLDFVIYGLPAAIIGARFYFVIFQWEFYAANPAEIPAIWNGGLAIHGGILGGLIVLITLCRRRKVSFWQSVDVLAPSLVIGQAIGRWGNFINQEAFGGPVTREYISRFPEFIQRQMYIGGAYRHPAFLYESLWNVLIFLLLLFFRRRDYIRTGDIFFLYIGGYSLGRFFIEGLRTDSLMVGPLRVAQFVSALAVITAIAALVYRHKIATN
ncbi:MAG: prolipoprotein diacylglyceryl transferase [Halanaerobiales bacterium]